MKEMVVFEIPETTATKQDIRRWIGHAKAEGAAAERTRIRRELLEEAQIEETFRQIADGIRHGGLSDLFASNVDRCAVAFRAHLNRICPEEG